MRPHSLLIVLATIVLSSCGGSSPISPSQGPGDYSGTVTIALLASSLSGPNTCAVAAAVTTNEPPRTIAVKVNVSRPDVVIIVPTSLYSVDGPDQTVFRGQLNGQSFEAAPTDLLVSPIYACAGGSTSTATERVTLSGTFAAGFTALSARQSETLTFGDGTVVATSYDWKASLSSSTFLPSSVTTATR
jgi:hypothetical protein